MAGRETIRHVQPIWSTSNAEARRRVIKLYKSWYRQIPHIGTVLLRSKKSLFCFVFFFASAFFVTLLAFPFNPFRLFLVCS